MLRRNFIWLGSLTGTGAVMGWQLRARAAAVQTTPAAYQQMADRIRPLFTAKTPPGPDDWLTSFPEPGQTFAQYAASHPNRPKADRSALYLVELGKFDDTQRKVFELLREYLGLVFGLAVKALPAIDPAIIPASARRTNPLTRAEQLKSTYILDRVLMARRPADGVALLALTPVDLWPGEGWNFVFGQASLAERVGVWSTARFGDPVKDAHPFLRRVLQVAAHEAGHMFGMEHCTAFQCGMNGSNSLTESDRTPLPFCAECEAKLWWACRLDPPPRAKRLADFAERNGFNDETTLWRATVKALEKRDDPPRS